MAGINLLPQEHRPRGVILKVSNIIKKVVIVGYIIFMVIAVGLVTTVVILGQRIRSSELRQEQLKVQIEALEETEQRLVLVQDRLNKVVAIRNADSASEEISVLKEVTDNLPEGVLFSYAELDNKSTSITVVADNSTSIGNFLAFLVAQPDYKKVELLSLKLSQGQVFDVEVNIKI
jgi:Tfp pilus assembly protein PilN